MADDRSREIDLIRSGKPRYRLNGEPWEEITEDSKCVRIAGGVMVERLISARMLNIMKQAATEMRGYDVEDVVDPVYENVDMTEEELLCALAIASEEIDLLRGAPE